jgi:hypothetical protein
LLILIIINIRLAVNVPEIAGRADCAKGAALDILEHRYTIILADGGRGENENRYAAAGP